MLTRSPTGPAATTRRPTPPSPPALTERPERWRWLLLGLALAWLLRTVLPGRFVWLMSALPHEMGHSTIGCLLGHPSAPAIGLSGDAWSGIAERSDWLAWAIAVAIGITAAVQARRGAIAAAAALGVAAVVVPLLAFSRWSEVAITAAGHVGEALFAGYCLSLAWTGGRTDTASERTACAFAGGLLQAHNLALCIGLMTSAAARSEYASNGSLGMKNDMLVLADDLLGWRVQSVAAAMLLAVLVLPLLGLAAGMWRGRRSEQR